MSYLLLYLGRACVIVVELMAKLFFFPLLERAGVEVNQMYSPSPNLNFINQMIHNMCDISNLFVALRILDSGLHCSCSSSALTLSPSHDL